MKKKLACCIIVASLAIANMVVAATGPPKEKMHIAQTNANAAARAAGQALVLTSIPANNLTEALTPKAGVFVFQTVARMPFGQQESGTVVIQAAPAGALFEKIVCITVGVITRPVAIASARGENPGCDIAAGFGQGILSAQGAAFT